MKTFKPGDRVKVIAGPRAGLVTVVTTVLHKARCLEDWHCPDQCWCGLGLPRIHGLDILSDEPDTMISAPPAWLEPWWDGKEAGEWTSDLLRMCKPSMKERT